MLELPGRATNRTRGRLAPWSPVTNHYDATLSNVLHGSSHPRFAPDPAVDPTVYPVEDDVGEDLLQRMIVTELLPEVRRWLAEQGEQALAGADQFIYWKQHDPFRCVSPDVYVLPGVDPDLRIGAWKVWETGIRPSFALEIVSRSVPKDYVRAPLRYAELGVDELIVFDPDASDNPSRIQWQVMQRQGGELRTSDATNRDRVASRVLRCWLRVVGEGSRQRLRLATGADGEVLRATAEERAQAEAERARAAEAESYQLRQQLEWIRRLQGR